jgi:hypothetical protein
VPEVNTVAVVVLPDGAGLEPPRHVVGRHPDLIVAVGEIDGVGQRQVVVDVFGQRQSRARVRFVGDQLRLDADNVETGGALDAAADGRADAAGQIRQHLFARHVVLFAAHLLERAAGHDHRHDVGLGQRRARGERGLGVARLAGDAEGDVVTIGLGVHQQVERREDAPIFDERHLAAFQLEGPFVERDQPALEHLEAAKQPGLVRRPDYAQVGGHFGFGDVVVDQHRGRRVDVDVEQHALQQRMAIRRQLERWLGGDGGQQPGVEVDVAGEAGFLDRHLAGDDDVALPGGDANVGVRQAAQIERRIKREIARRDLDIDVARSRSIDSQAAFGGQRSAIDVS